MLLFLYFFSLIFKLGNKQRMAEYRDITDKIYKEIDKINKDIRNLSEMVNNVAILEKKYKNTYYNTQVTYTDNGSSKVYYLTYDATNQVVYLQTSDTTSDYTKWTLVSTLVVAGQNNISLQSNVYPFPYITIDSTNSTIICTSTSSSTTMAENSFGFQDWRQGAVSGTTKSNFQIKGLTSNSTAKCWTPASHPPSVGTLITLTNIKSPPPPTNQFQFIIPSQD